MEAVVDSLRRIINRWVNTVAPLIEDAAIGDDVLSVRSTVRFKVGDEILIRNATKRENPANFRITEVIDKNQIRVSSPIALKNWKVSEGALVQKLVNGNFVEQVYYGDPANLSHVPAITVRGLSEDIEIITFDSVNIKYAVEIGIYVEDSTDEGGERFMNRIAKEVRNALLANQFPLVNDYSITTLLADIADQDVLIRVADSSLFTCGSMILIENQYKARELRVQEVVDATTIRLEGNGCPTDFLMEDGTTVIAVNRFIWRSLPSNVEYRKVQRGSLMKAAFIQWSGEEENVPLNKGEGWSDPQIH